MSGNPLNWHNPEHIPNDVQCALLSADELVRLFLNKSLGGLIEELGGGFDLFRGLSQSLGHLPLFPLSPLRGVSGEEEAWAVDNRGYPLQEGVPERLLVFENSSDLTIFLDLAHTVGGFGSNQVVLFLPADLGQNLVHRLGSHEWEPGVRAVVRVLIRESTKEESTEHGTEPRVLWRPYAVSQTPGGEVVGGEISGKEAVPTDESNCVCEDGARDGVTRAQTSTLDDRLSGLCLEAGVKLKVINVAVKFFGGGGDFFVWIPFQECLVSSQAEILGRCENLKTGPSTVGVLAYLPEVIQRTTAPPPSGLDTHDFHPSHIRGSSPSAERSSWVLGPEPMG